MVSDTVVLSAQVMRAILATVSGRMWSPVRSIIEEKSASAQALRFREEINSVAEALGDPSGILDGPSRRYVVQTCEASLRKLLEESPELEDDFQAFVRAAETVLQRTPKVPSESSLLIRPDTGLSMPQISVGAAPGMAGVAQDDQRYIDWQVDWETLLAQRSELLAGTHMEFSGDRTISAKRNSRLQVISRDLATLTGLVDPPFELLPGDLYGKEEALAGLEGGLDEPDGNIHLLCGEPGAGKRIVALAAADNAKKRGRKVWWVRGTPELIGACMTAIAVQLNVDPAELAEAQAGRRSLSDLVWENLEGSGVPWLLVFDDVDDRTTLERYLSSDKAGSGWIRPSKAGIVLVTSRYSDVNIPFRHVVIHQVKPFAPEDAVHFLISSAPAAGTRDEAAKLARYLKGLPLACRLAAACISSPATPPTTFRRYLAELKGSSALTTPEWLTHIQRQGGDPWLGLSARIILHSMNRAESAAAWTLLAILAYFAPGAPLATSVLDPWALADTGLLAWRVPEADEVLTDALDRLVSLGLIESTTRPVDEAGKARRDIRMHPMISLTCRLIVQEAPSVAGVSQDHIWIAGATLLHQAAEQRSKAGDLSWIGGHELTPHIVALIVSLPGSSPPTALEEAVQAARIAMNHLAQIGAHLRAEQLGRRAIEVSQHLPHDDPAALTVAYDLTRILMARGRLGEAQDLLQGMLATSQLTRGLDNEISVDALETLASLLHERGKTDQAEQMLRQVTRARERNTGQGSAATIRSLTALARVLSEQGKLAEMERLTRGVLSIVRNRYGLGEQETLSAESDLGATFRLLGRLYESKQILRQVLDAQEALLGPDHPDTCNTMAELAETFRDLGDLVRARETFEDVVARRRRVLGADNVETINAQAQLAETLRDLARFSESEDLLRSVLRVRSRTLGADHPEALNTRLGLAVLLRDTGQLAEAEEILKDVIVTCEGSLRPDHPVALSACHNLATIFQATGRVDEADQLYRDVLDKREWTLGPNHPETLRTLVNLGSLLHLRGSLDDAEHTLRQAEAAYGEIYGRQHPHTMTVLTNIANVLLDRGMVQKAKDHYSEILAAQELVLGSDHPDTLITRVNLAVALTRLGDLEEADRLLRRAIVGYEHIFQSRDHPSLLKARYHLASLRERSGDWRGALDGYLQILEMQVEKLGEDHPDAIATRLSISRVLESLGRDEESHSEYRHAIRLASQNPERSRPSAARFGQALGMPGTAASGKSLRWAG
jgi:tetratricopeptide (TPR) repeat protein